VINFKLTVIEGTTDIEINKLLEECEKVGTIGSPSSTTKLTTNIMEYSIENKLIGELAIFKYRQNKKSHYTLGQITEATLKNNLLEDSTMQSIARITGSVRQVSGTQDVHIGSFSPSAVFSHNPETNIFEQSILGTVPSTGTPMFQASNRILDKLLERYLDQLFYLGHNYGSDTKLPMWFKHFGHGPNGNGEAFHMGIFGATGSGKSTLAQRILIGYSRHNEMGLLILDPVGEFSKNMTQHTIRNQTEGSNLDYGSIVESLGKKLILINVRNLVLDRWEIFKQILKESSFFRVLTVDRENRTNAIELLENKIKNKKINLTDLLSGNSFEFVMRTLRDEENHEQIFSEKEQRSRLKNRLSVVDDEELYLIWKKVCTLFAQREGAYTVSDLLSSFKNYKKPFVIVDLSEQSVHELKLDYWTETIQTLILVRLLRGLSELGEEAWYKGESLNTLVVLDEAHRFAGKKYESDINQNSHLEALKARLIDYARTTRKYGLGWMFISTSLSSI
jgi:Helicase HerA, central domain